MNEMLKRIGQTFGFFQEKRQSAYVDLVRHLAVGEEVDVEESAGLLDAVGKNPEDLTRDVQRKKRRLELTEAINKATDLEGEETALHGRIVAANKVLAEAKRRRDEAIRPLAARLDEIQRLRNAAADARRELSKTADPGLWSEYRANDVRLLALAGTIGQTEESIRHLRARQLDARAEVLQEELDPLIAERDALLSRQREIESELLIP